MKRYTIVEEKDGAVECHYEVLNEVKDGIGVEVFEAADSDNWLSVVSKIGPIEEKTVAIVETREKVELIVADGPEEIVAELRRGEPITIYFDCGIALGKTLRYVSK